MQTDKRQPRYRIDVLVDEAGNPVNLPPILRPGLRGKALRIWALALILTKEFADKQRRRLEARGYGPNHRRKK